MDKRTGPPDGPDDHLADAGGSSVGHDGGRGGSADTTRSNALSSDGGSPTNRDPLVDAVEDPHLSVFLARANEVLQTRPIEFTARRHLEAIRVAAGETAVPRRHPVARFVAVAAAAAVAVVTLAGFGALPAPAQQVMSEVADRLGFTIPNPDTDPVGPARTPPKRFPAPESVPGTPGGPDRSELPGLREDGVLQTPGRSNGMTPPGQDGSRTPPGLDEGRTPPGQDEDRTSPGQGDGTSPGVDDKVPPGQDREVNPPGRTDGPDRRDLEERPGAPDDPPGTDPPGAEPPGADPPGADPPSTGPPSTSPPGRSGDGQPGRSDPSPPPARGQGPGSSEDRPAGGPATEDEPATSSDEGPRGSNADRGGPPGP